MADVKQILVVDDHFEMLEFLRSMLEMSNQEYQVLGVPSAEEGLLELRRTPFDLLITDVRLPGMSGFDLARKVQKIRPQMPIIMITGYSSEQGKQEANELGVFRYFKKPLDTDGLLAAVHLSLYGDEVVETQATPEAVQADISPEVRKRLEMLRSDTGARQAILASAAGQLLCVTGSGSQGVDMAQLAATIAGNVESSFRVAEQLGSADPFTIQYQAGEQYDLYSANVGRNYFVAIFFDALARRGRIGTIWVFAQRAIGDLQGLLAGTGQAAPAETKAEPARRKAEPAPEPTRKVEPARSKAELTPPKQEEPAPPPRRAEPARTKVEPAPEPPRKVGSVAVVPEPAEESKPISLEEAQKLFGIDLSHLGPQEAAEVDLDSFWDSALAEEDQALSSSGMSLEEARNKGLIPTEFDQDEVDKVTE
ncbi:MAG: response regulator [Chloroflexi bacterium]|nr:response regulator [Chloroflexota bacterium]MCI0578871.1 response regulator [Chloroflexota bacterium]MCI0649112.1 response regulator [Chloroflexota bacterium]MCI0727027.1 response regulator [Chloroflexota bacterium]